MALQLNNFSGGTVTGNTEGSNSWESLVANRKNTVNMGAVISSDGTNPGGPTSFSVNGSPCTVTG